MAGRCCDFVFVMRGRGWSITSGELSAEYPEGHPKSKANTKSKPRPTDRRHHPINRHPHPISPLEVLLFDRQFDVCSSTRIENRTTAMASPVVLVINEDAGQSGNHGVVR